MNAQPLAAIVDTNVVLDVASVHEVRRLVDGHAVASGRTAWARQEVQERIARARGGLLLAVYFDSVSATTLGAREEMLRLLGQAAPPAAGGASLVSDFTTFNVHFVQAVLLSRWTHTIPTTDETVVGSGIDRMLVEQARSLDLPLISYEGRDRLGRVRENKKGNIRARARKVGVQPYTPEEFLAAKGVDLELLGSDFLARFDAKAPRYLHDHHRREEGARLLVEWLRDFYAHALRGLPPDLPATSLTRRIRTERLRDLTCGPFGYPPFNIFVSTLR